MTTQFNSEFKKKFNQKFIAGVIAVWSMDILTKIWAVQNLVENQHKPFLGDTLQFVLRFNTGGIFGIFQNNALFFQFMTGIAIILLIVFYVKTPSNVKIFDFAVSLILGGALGNFTDRFFREGVVDFIDMGIGSSRWPTYNLADAFITIGAAFLLYSLYLIEKEEKLASEGAASESAKTQDPPKKTIKK